MLLGNQLAAEPHVTAGKLKVCHIASGDLWAGAEVQILTLLKCLNENPGLYISLMALNEGRLTQEARELGIEVVVLAENSLAFLQILSRATSYIYEGGYQVLHSHRYKENLLSVLLAQRCGVPVTIRTQHGLPEPFHGARGFKHNLVSRLDTLVAKYATNAIISVSSDLTMHLAQQISPAKLRTIRNGLCVDKVHSTFTCKQAKERLGISADSIVVGTAGRLEQIKRLDLFIEAASVLRTEIENVRFVIVGSGSQRNALEELALSAGMQECISFLGHRDDIFDVLRAFDLFVMCSDHEGLPMVLLETLALRLPVVARSVGGISEVIKEGVNGCLVTTPDPSELARTCARLLTMDDNQREQIAEAGRATVMRDYSAYVTGASVLKLYRELLEAR